MLTTKTKPELLEEITQAIADQVLTPEDLERFAISDRSYAQTSETDRASTESPHHDNHSLSAVDVLFHIAGLILFVAIVSFIIQSWEAGSTGGHILLSGGVGVILWVVAAVLNRQSQTAILEGLKSSLLLTGSLSLILGAYIITNELLGTYDKLDFFPFAVMLLVVSALHFAFDRVVKSNIILLLGIFLAVAAFPVAFFGILSDVNAPVDAWAVVFLLTAALLAAAPRALMKVYTDKPGLGRVFDSFAAFIALGAMYVASFGSHDVLWLFALILAIIGLFYASIIRREKPLLGSASVFLVIAIITISFRYFSDFGVTFSLIVAAAGILGTAAISTTISKKYLSSQG